MLTTKTNNKIKHKAKKRSACCHGNRQNEKKSGTTANTKQPKIIPIHRHSTNPRAQTPTHVSLKMLCSHVFVVLCVYSVLLFESTTLGFHLRVSLISLALMNSQIDNVLMSPLHHICNVSWVILGF